jgi:carbon-monoxide dehydrogenase medium subunit
MHPFEYLGPRSVREALEALREHGAEAKVLAGGQSLLPILSYRLARPRFVVDINGLSLAGIGVEDGRLRLGALVRYHELEESAEIARDCPILAEAARLIGNVRVRSLGTVGGSLAHADPAAELPVVMAALDARLTVRSSSGSRTVDIDDFIGGYMTTALAPDELLTDVEIPAVPGMGHAVEEYSRRAGDFAVVAVAALVGVDGRGRTSDVRLAFGGVADRPVRVAAAEQALRGHEPTAERIARAADLARDGLDPQSDAFVSAAYRRLLAGVLARRALARAVARALEAR